jgi:RNA polymerase sigma factor FliA
MSTQTDWELIRTGDTEARNRIWVEHQISVNFVAQKISSGLPKHVDLDDLKSAGQFGLLDAIEKYDPERGYKFETYAINRIRGAILDDLRSLDWVPRSVRSKERQIDAAINDLTHELGRAPTVGELCDLLDMEPKEILKVQNSSAAGTIFNIDMPVDHDTEMTVADGLTDDLGDLSDGVAGFDMTKIVGAIDDLPERERLTIALHYYLGCTLADIGKRFAVTESRVCQIHTRALKSIRKELLA